LTLASAFVYAGLGSELWRRPALDRSEIHGLVGSYFHREVAFTTGGRHEFSDLTEDLRGFVGASGVEAGLVNVQCMHTTAGLVVNEVESGLRSDFAELADRLVPSAHAYRHDDLTVRWENLCPEDAEAPNGHSHLQSAIFGAPSILLGVHEGQPVLGRWQRVLLVEFDRPRPRRVVMQVFGMSASGSGRREDGARPSRFEPAAPAAAGSASHIPS
jgi:secondary thiamine-phosphate synthase enzyme